MYHPSSIEIKALSQQVQQMHESLIILCGHTEGLLELKFATFLTKIAQPLNNLNLFLYYGNYIKLANLEYGILNENGVVQPKKATFVGSGPMLLTSIIMASQHMKSTHFDNFDIDEVASDIASLVRMSKEEKMKILGHLRKYIKEGGALLVRTAKEARAFLYPVVEENDLLDFELLSIFHPINDVINSVIFVRKPVV
ncbi:hypothetical protein QYF36_016320 [Acer negundo]|nr:hypothetical protein QYF36_016320 [Acer negundo]